MESLADNLDPYYSHMNSKVDTPKSEGGQDAAEILEVVSRACPVGAEQEIHVHSLVDELEPVGRDVLELVAL